MRVSLSGFAAVGKTTVAQILAERYGWLISSETARETLITNKYMSIPHDPGRVFQRSVMEAEFSKLHFCLSNKIEGVIFDRNIVDNLVFAKRQFGKIEIKEFQSHIDSLRSRYNIEYLYDKTYLIRIPKDEKFIKEALKDKFRAGTTSQSPSEFIEMGQEWEIDYIKTISKLSGVTNQLSIINHFTDTSNDISSTIKKIALDINL